MTWNTPLGDRTLDVPEQCFFKIAMRRMSKLLTEFESDDRLQTGVLVFDNLSGCQQLVMLDCARSFLFEPTSDLNPPTASVEGTVGAIISFVRHEISYELDIDREVQLDPQIEPRRRWRKLLCRVFKPYDWRINLRLSMLDWDSILGLFHDRILHNRDYLFDATHDFEDETSVLSSQSLLETNAYYSRFNQPDPSGPEMLGVIRRLTASYT